MTLRDLQDIVDDWITTTGRGYFPVLTNALLLAEETGEVARVVARKYGEQIAKPGDKSDLGDELADVIWVAAAIANQTGIDLTEAIGRNLQKKTDRDKSRFAGKDK